MSDSQHILQPEPDEAWSGSQETTQFDRPPEPFCPPIKPPDRIGPYRLEGPLGHGGMGEVFLAWDELLERRVAIKRIRQGTPQTPDQRKRFRREAQAAARLSHSAIVQIHGLIPDLSGDSIVMEYIEGVTLGDRIAAGPVPVREALRLAREIAEGLASAHSAGLIHRDLKPDNVVITQQGQAKILDFGLVKPLNEDPQEPSLTRQGVLLGTYQSMSPEQASCRPVDERSDLFSLGVLLYEMLSGHSPFRGTSALDTVKRVTTHHPPSLSTLSSTIPQGVSDLVDRLLAKSPDSRPPNARSVIRMLQELEVSQPLSSSDSVSEMITADLTKLARKGERQAPPLISTGGMSVQRRRWHAVAAGVVALLALVGVMAAYFILRPPPPPRPTTSSRPSRPRRVVVLRPEVTSPNNRSAERTASGVLAFSPGIIASFEGVVPVDPVFHTNGSPAEIKKAVGADEVITGTIEPGVNNLVQVTLKRIRARDDALLWSAEFPVPTGPSDVHLLADALAAHLRQAYSDKALRPGVLDVKVSDEDYAEFLTIRGHREAGNMTLLLADLTTLEHLLQTSPHFLDARILAAKISLYLSRLNSDPTFLERAVALANDTKRLAPEDPRVLTLIFRCNLAKRNMADAETILTRLETLLPGDPDVMALRASLDEKNDRIDKAIQEMSAAVRAIPTWQNLYTLALWEARNGRIEDARRHFQNILAQSSENEWAQRGLADLEILFGDLNRARILLEKLSQSPALPKSQPPNQDALTNLGFVNFLLGRYEKAAEIAKSVLARQPNSTAALMNLADAEIELNGHAEAKTHYQKVIALFALNPQALDSPKNQILKAECLARLGRSPEAVTMVAETLRKDSDDVVLLFDASLVYSLAGEKASALSNAQAALKKGLQPSWFRAYRSLPQMLSLLEAASTSHPTHQTAS